ncbi:hypothetical protein GW17_00041680 [Ensete ventricosum]|nr:hypothetical protein GW17_00041680 [Ensete ventricosum]
MPVAALHAFGVGSRCYLRVAPRRLATWPHASAAPAGSRSYQRPPLQAAALSATVAPCDRTAGSMPLRPGRWR